MSATARTRADQCTIHEMRFEFGTEVQTIHSRYYHDSSVIQNIEHRTINIEHRMQAPKGRSPSAAAAARTYRFGTEGKAAVSATARTRADQCAIYEMRFEFGTEVHTLHSGANVRTGLRDLGMDRIAKLVSGFQSPVSGADARVRLLAHLPHPGPLLKERVTHFVG